MQRCCNSNDGRRLCFCDWEAQTQEERETDCAVQGCDVHSWEMSAIGWKWTPAGTASGQKQRVFALRSEKGALRTRTSWRKQQGVPLTTQSVVKWRRQEKLGGKKFVIVKVENKQEFVSSHWNPIYFSKMAQYCMFLIVFKNSSLWTSSKTLMAVSCFKLPSPKKHKHCHCT